MATTISTPDSEVHVLAAGVPKIVGGGYASIVVQIPTGSTVTISMTCATNAEINAGTAEWIDWPNGAQAGPFMDTLLYSVTALKLLSAAGGKVYLVRK